MSLIQTISNRLQQPEYTGDNRCTPCTVVNFLIAFILSRLIATRSAFAGLGSFVAFSSTIYFRGYLVPGTPTLTKRYFPDWLLRLFNKQPIGRRVAGSTEIELESVLCRANAIKPCNDGEFCVTESFRTAWLKNAESLRNHDFGLSQISEIMERPEEQLMITDHELGTLLVLANESSENDDIIA